MLPRRDRGTRDNVLVTGGAGYIGCVLVPRLLERGHGVRVLDKLVFGADGLGPVEGQIELFQGDICTLDEGVLDDVDCVIHLAGLSNDPTAEFNPAANMRINVEGTRNLALACVRRGVPRFVLASSCSIYYRRDPYEGLLDERAGVNPTAPYSLSKVLCERQLGELASPAFCPVFLRKGTVFGPSPRMRYDLVVNAFVRDAWRGGRLTVFNGGEMWRPLLDVRDAADAYVRALELPAEQVRGRAFNLLHKNYRILELAHWTKHVLRDRRPIEVDVQYGQGPPPRSYQVSGARFAATFGYSPPRGIAAAALELWERMEQGIATDFDNPEYSNIAWLQLLSSVESRLLGMGPLFPSEISCSPVKGTSGGPRPRPEPSSAHPN